MAKKPKFEVHVRAPKTRILNPDTGRVEVVRRGHVFRAPWPELIKMAARDKKHRVFALVEIKKSMEEIKDGNE